MKSKRIFIGLAALLGIFTHNHAMNSFEASREHFDNTLNNADPRLMNFNTYMDLYTKLAKEDRTRSDTEELLNILMLEYLAELDVEGHTQIQLFFLRQDLSNYKAFILSNLP